MRLVVIVGLCCLLILVAIAVAIAPIAVKSEQEAKSFAKRQALALEFSAIGVIQELLASAESAAQLWIRTIEDGGANIPATLPNIIPVAWSILRDNVAFEQVTFGSAGGDLIAMDTPASRSNKDPDASHRQAFIKLRFDGQVLSGTNLTCRTKLFWDYDDMLNFSHIDKPKCDYVVTERSWYKTISALSKNYSTQPAPWTSDHPLVMTAPEPNNSGERVTISLGRFIKVKGPFASTIPPALSTGVAVVDFSTRTFGPALEGVRLSQNGFMALYDVINDGVLSLTPPTVSTVHLDPDDEDEVLGMRKLHELSSSHLMPHIYAKLGASVLQDSTFLATPQTHIVNIDGHGDVIVAIQDAYRFNGTLHWRMILAMPESDYTQDITNNRNLIIAIVVPLSVLIVLLQLALMVILVAMPLAKVSDEMEKTSQLQQISDEVREMKPFVTEVSQIHKSYVDMAGKINLFRGYISSAVLARLDAAGTSDSTADENEEELQDDPMQGSKTVNIYPAKSSGAGESMDSESGTGNTSRSRRSTVVSDRASHYSDSSSRQGNNNKISHAGTRHSGQGHTSRSTTATVRLFGLAEPLSTKSIAVVVVNIRNFSKLPMEKMRSVHGFMTTAVTNAAAKSRGIVDYFHGDHFFITYNAATNVSCCARRAAEGCCELRAALAAAKDVMFSAGAATGTAIVGFLGNDNLSRFCSVGDVFDDACRAELFGTSVQRQLEDAKRLERKQQLKNEKDPQSADSSSIPSTTPRTAAAIEKEHVDDLRVFVTHDFADQLDSSFQRLAVGFLPPPTVPGKQRKTTNKNKQLLTAVVYALQAHNPNAEKDLEWMYHVGVENNEGGENGAAAINEENENLEVLINGVFESFSTGQHETVIELGERIKRCLAACAAANKKTERRFQFAFGEVHALMQRSTAIGEAATTTTQKAQQQNHITRGNEGGGPASVPHHPNSVEAEAEGNGGGPSEQQRSLPGGTEEEL